MRLPHRPGLPLRPPGRALRGDAPAAAERARRARRLSRSRGRGGSRVRRRAHPLRPPRRARRARRPVRGRLPGRGPREPAYDPVLRDVAGRAEAAEVLVAADDAALLGTVTLVLDGGPMREISEGDEGEFRMLAVDPAAQGRGAGAALVEACAARARDRGRQALVASSQDRMLPRPRALPPPRLRARAGARLVADRRRRPDRLHAGAVTARQPPSRCSRARRTASSRVEISPAKRSSSRAGEHPAELGTRCDPELRRQLVAAYERGRRARCAAARARTRASRGRGRGGRRSRPARCGRGSRAGRPP